MSKKQIAAAKAKKVVFEISHVLLPLQNSDGVRSTSTSTKKANRLAWNLTMEIWLGQAFPGCLGERIKGGSRGSLSDGSVDTAAVEGPGGGLSPAQYEHSLGTLD